MTAIGLINCAQARRRRTSELLRQFLALEGADLAEIAMDVRRLITAERGTQ
jgi:hypothetical protein